LIKAREIARLMQARMARRMDTTQSAVARIESAHNPPNLRTLERYAEAIARRIEVRLVKTA
jgi:transcriptional regulator with XRE-family HTH domain